MLRMSRVRVAPMKTPSSMKATTASSGMSQTQIRYAPTTPRTSADVVISATIDEPATT